MSNLGLQPSEGWRSRILALLDRDHDLPEPEWDGMLYCDPVVPYNAPSDAWQVFAPVWRVSGGLFWVKAVLVTSAELEWLFALPREAFRSLE